MIGRLLCFFGFHLTVNDMLEQRGFIRAFRPEHDSCSRCSRVGFRK